MEFMQQRAALDTYRYLRIGMAALLVLLATSVVDQIVRTNPNCELGSISAYYYTSARAVFVACLCAVGACLIIYRGNTYVWKKPRGRLQKDDLEDFFLNISGFLAFIVALVPTPLKGMDIKPGTVVEGEPVCKRSNVPTTVQLEDALDNNILALLIAATLVLLISFCFALIKSGAPSSAVSIAWLVFAVGLGVFWFLYLKHPDWVRQNAHIYAAIAMFVGIVVVVLLNTRNADKKYRIAYLSISAALLVSLAVLVPMWLSGNYDHVLFWLEASVIAFFALFWIVQTAELWNVEQRSEL